jgi:3'-5' exoribonuclease
MPRRFISQFGEREKIDDVFVVTEKQLRPNKNGNLYLMMRLSDRTGTVSAMMWNANDRTGRDFDSGDYVRIEGTTQHYNGSMQIIVNYVEPAEPGIVNEDELLQVDQQQSEKLMSRLADLLRAISDVNLQYLGEAFLVDEELMRAFKAAPAGIKAHHAYQGGLLEHVVSLMELAVMVANHYPEVDKDLLVMGAFLHDVGKVRELSFDRGLGYSDEGQLIGHLTIGIEMVDEKILEAEKLSGEKFPKEIALRLKHMVQSHHGEPNYGSPKVPMTFEAIALRNLDEMDSKIGTFRQIIQDDINDGSGWTNYQPNLGRKIFKGTRH